ncbi:MAG TPA: efflux RND transporter permease subunit [Gammaproteobacteria bacterium]|jgi:multidrug efflux pump|nr:efflux RND transporter permease subunit [Gammaproteobacteria bacterium]
MKNKQLTDLFIRRPVLATVISLLILAMGLRAIFSLPVMQYPFTENAQITVSTAYTGADPASIAAFITTPLENSIAQANGIDYMTSSSTANFSTILVNLLLNYDPLKGLSDVNTKVNAVLNQLPKSAQLPVITVAVGQTIDSMYIGFYSPILPDNDITDYLIRVVQPKLQAINGVQVAELIGQRQFALRAWLDPVKLSGMNLTPAEVATAMGNNDFISAAGRTDGNTVILNFTADTNLSTVEQFKNLVLKQSQGAIVRLKDVGTVDLGAQNYNSAVSFDGKASVYIGIKISPTANLLSVINQVKSMFPSIQSELPEGLHAKIVYDASDYVNSSIREVIKSLLEAFFIVSIVIYLFLGSLRSVFIPLIAIPLSIIGTFFIMLVLHYSINLLTLLALVLAIGLVVDDAIIVVENVQRHMEEGKTAFQAAILGARELTGPIVAITVVLIAVYLPIGFMGGLTGALFTEFAFTLAGAVTVSAVIALTLSPMMCSTILKNVEKSTTGLIHFVDEQFEKLQHRYEQTLHHALDALPVTAVFAVIILSSNYFLFITSNTELAPQEDQGIIMAQVNTPANASLSETHIAGNEVYKIYKKYPETMQVFQIDGTNNNLNSSIVGMVLRPWDQRTQTSNQLQPLVQDQLDTIAGAKIAAFQLPSLPGGGSGLPIQFVITTTQDFNNLNIVVQSLLQKAYASGLFMYLDPDLKLDQVQATITLNRDKVSELGLNMRDISNVLGAALSEGYINYFNFAGRSYQVIPQMIRKGRINTDEILNYYIKTITGDSVPLSTVAKIKTTVVPESINHFQQLNSATISAIAFPGITMGDALGTLKKLANETLPDGYSIDYAAQSRQYIQEGSALILTFFFALIIIFLSLAALFESFRDPLIVLISVPMSICGAMIFVSLGIGGATVNIYSEVGLVTLIGLISKHGILIVQFANDLQTAGKSKREAIQSAAAIRLRPILMTTAAMVLGVIPLIRATGAGALSRYNIGLVIATGISIGTLFTLFVVPAMYMILAEDHAHKRALDEDIPETSPEGI